MNKTILAAVAMGLAIAAVGCKHHDQDAKGPAEKAGEKVDNAAEKTKDATGNAMEKTGHAVSDAGADMK